MQVKEAKLVKEKLPSVDRESSRVLDPITHRASLEVPDRSGSFMEPTGLHQRPIGGESSRRAPSVRQHLHTQSRPNRVTNQAKARIEAIHSNLERPELVGHEVVFRGVRPAVLAVGLVGGIGAAISGRQWEQGGAGVGGVKEDGLVLLGDDQVHGRHAGAVADEFPDTGERGLIVGLLLRRASIQQRVDGVEEEGLGDSGIEEEENENENAK